MSILENTRRLTAEDLGSLNERLEGLSPQEMISWAHGRFGKKLCLLSAFQQAGCMLCHMVAELGLQDDIDVIFVDTGVNFQETLETVDRISKDYGLRIVTLHPERTMAEQTKAEGVLYLDPAGQKRCCHLRKKVPLQQIRGKYEGMLSSLRRGSGGQRGNIAPIAIDQELNLLRIHPLLNTTREEMDLYIRDNNVLINPLHEQGFPTVSCNRCTTPVLAGEEERAGRWRHLENAAKYCGINPSDLRRGGDNSEFVELQFETVERVLDFEI